MTLGTLHFADSTTAAADGSDSGEPPRDGSRCDSAASGAQAFTEALAADHALPAAERETLAKARAGLAVSCETNPAASAAEWPGGIASGSGQAFLAYLKAADAFYRGDWAAARSGFAALVKRRQRWVAETAAYMIVRVELGAAIAGDFDKYGDFGGAAQADHAAAARAGAAIAAYLHDWPQGRYTASATGLQRRALWLAGDQTALGRAYEALLLRTPPTQPEVIDLINEADAKLLTEAGAAQQVDAPLLLTVLDLVRMRTVRAEDGAARAQPAAPLLPAPEVAAQRARFASRPELYAYLQAARAYYVDHDAKAAAALAPAAGAPALYRPLEFSGAVLHGMALADLRDSGEPAYWRGLLGGAGGLYQRPLVEVALARNFERSRQLAAAFAPGSPLTEAEPRTILLQHDAGPALLRSLAHGAGSTAPERAAAAFALLWKELSRGHYTEFLADLDLARSNAAPPGAPAPNDWQPADDAHQLRQFLADGQTEGYPCPRLADTVTTLAWSRADPHAMLCLGEFYRLRLDSFPALDIPARADELGSGPSDFAGAPTTRGRFYDLVIADPRAAPADKAYALYRAIRCYAPSGINDCGGADVPLAQRRAWFDRLKHDYPASAWAKALRFYW